MTPQTTQGAALSDARLLELMQAADPETKRTPPGLRAIADALVNEGRRLTAEQGGAPAEGSPPSADYQAGWNSALDMMQRASLRAALTTQPQAEPAEIERLQLRGQGMNIEAMAREAGFNGLYVRELEHLAKFAAIVRAEAMREAAVIAEQTTEIGSPDMGCETKAYAAAAAILAAIDAPGVPVLASSPVRHPDV